MNGKDVGECPLFVSIVVYKIVSTAVPPLNIEYLRKLFELIYWKSILLYIFNILKILFNIYLKYFQCF